MVLSLQDCINKYGKIENGKWSDESKWMIVCQIPDFIANIWINSASNQPTRHIYINKDAKQALLGALQNLSQRGLAGELRSFDGCFCIRDVRAVPGQPSCHSYGLAVDLNAKSNPLGAIPVLSSEFVKCFTDAGWAWGGNFHRKDGMHFSRAWE